VVAAANLGNLPALPGPSIAVTLTAGPLLAPSASSHAGQALSDTGSPARGPTVLGDTVLVNGSRDASERVLTGAWLRALSVGDDGDFDGLPPAFDLNWDLSAERPARQKPTSSPQTAPQQTAPDRAAMDLYFAQVSEGACDADHE
jgi:hypothetical protein